MVAVAGMLLGKAAVLLGKAAVLPGRHIGDRAAAALPASRRQASDDKDG
jgi:hypothetical protein